MLRLHSFRFGFFYAFESVRLDNQHTNVLTDLEHYMV
jgi:hypothetical protein